MRAILITGDRHATLREWEYIVAYVVTGSDRILHGAARGIDSIAAELAANRGVLCEAFPADWSIGKSAGPMRNVRMLDRLRFLRDTSGYDIEVAAFHNDLSTSRGTAHMVSIARRSGVKVTLYRSTGVAP